MYGRRTYLHIAIQTAICCLTRARFIDAILEFTESEQIHYFNRNLVLKFSTSVRILVMTQREGRRESD